MDRADFAADRMTRPIQVASGLPRVQGGSFLPKLQSIRKPQSSQNHGHTEAAGVKVSSHQHPSSINLAKADAQAEEETSSAHPASFGQLSPELLRQLRELQARDREVRQHEQSHVRAGGVYASAPRLRYERGPDGRLYAVSGEVTIDTREIPSQPERTIAKLEKVIQAALAPVNPSPQDVRVAVRAAATIARLRAELAVQEQTESHTQTKRSTEPRLLADRENLKNYLHNLHEASPNIFLSA